MSTPPNVAASRNDTAQLRRENLRAITLLVMLGGWTLALTYLAGYAITREARFFHLLVMQITYGLALTLSWSLQYGKRYQAAIGLMFLASFAASFIIVYTVEGIGLTLSVLMTLGFSLIAWQTLPVRAAALTTLLTILVQGTVFVMDTRLATENRLPGGVFISTLLVIAGGTFIFALLINGLRGIQFRRIGNQMRAFFLVVSIVPVLIVTIFQTATLANVLTRQAEDDLRKNAAAVTTRLNNQLVTLASYIEEDASNPAIRNYLKKPDGNISFLVLLAARYPGLISYGLLDKDGILVVDHRGATRGNERNTAYFQAAISTRITYISNILLDEDTRRGVFYVSKPVLDEQGQLLGVLRAKISAEPVQTIAQESASQFGAGFVVMIVDEANIVLAHSANPELRWKILGNPPKSIVNELQQAGRLPLGGQISAGLDELAEAINRAQPESIFTGLIQPEQPGQDYITLSTTIYKPWKVLVAQNAQVFLTPARNQTLLTLLILLFLLGAVYFGANLAAGLLVTPINQLATAAEELGKGNLTAPFDLTRKDELGTLAIVLENARKRIADLLQTLEQRVEERTQELVRANEKNERRAQQLTLVSLVAHSIASVQNLDDLLQEITHQVSDVFGYYHVGIFLVDENREYAVLRAANSPGGQAMLARGHRLKVGRQGIVGNVTNTGRYRIALDVGQDAVFFNNPDLPHTRSEAAIPLMIGDDIIGALDVQSTEPNAFNEDDMFVLSLLADQISIAIQNARLFDNIRAALAQFQQIYTEAQKTGWQTLTGDLGASGYRYAQGSLEVLRRASETVTADGTLEVPITVREERLGVLKIRRPNRKTGWTEAETRMYQAIAERMAFALENARLFAEARRRANLEQAASKAASRISATTQFESILRNAAEEISRFLEGAEVLVQIQPEALEKPAGKPLE